jgi:hypothetical protein
MRSQRPFSLPAEVFACKPSHCSGLPNYSWDYSILPCGSFKSHFSNEKQKLYCIQYKLGFSEQEIIRVQILSEVVLPSGRNFGRKTQEGLTKFVGPEKSRVEFRPLYQTKAEKGKTFFYSFVFLKQRMLPCKNQNYLQSTCLL